MRRILTLVLACAMAVTLFTACGGNGKDSGKGNSSGTNAARQLTTNDFLYVPAYITPPGDVTEIQNAVLVGDDVYFFATKVTGTRKQLTADNAMFGWGQTASYNEDGSVPAGYHEEEVDVSEQRLFKMDADGASVTELPAFTHPAIPETATPGTAWTIGGVLDAGDGSVWINETGYFGYSDPNNPSQYVDDTRLMIRRVSLADGSVLAEIDGSALRAGNPYFSITYFLADSKGNLYVAGYDGATHIYNNTGADMGTVTIPQGGYIQNMVRMPDGNVAVLFSDMTGVPKLKAIDVTTRQLTSDYGNLNISTNTFGGFGFGGTDSGFCGYSDDGQSMLWYDTTALYSVKPNEDRKELINWIDSDVDPSGIQVLGTLSNGKIFALNITGGNASGGMFGGGFYAGGGFGGNTAQTIDVIQLTKTPLDQVPVKKILTLACVQLDTTLRAEVLDFNKKDPNYRIKIIDYSVYNTSTDYTAGITKLNTEIVGGNVPDILYTGALPISNYISQGLIEDLYPLLDGDTALGGRESVVPAYLKALENNGKLYQISSGFMIITLTGNADVVGDGDGWNMDDVNKVLADNPNAKLFPDGFDRSTALNLILTLNISKYVDPETGTCKFNTPEFIKLLDFIKTNFPESVDYSNMGAYADPNAALINGTQLVQLGVLTNFDSFMNADALFNKKAVFKGFPVEDKNGNAFMSTLGLAMSTTCADKDGAWSFMRRILTKEYQAKSGGFSGFPSNQALLAERAQEAMTENNDIGFYAWTPEAGKDSDGDGSNDVWPKGQVGGGFGSTTQAIYYYAMTQTQYDRYMSFINGIASVTESDSSLTNIITEELGPFFAGQKSATDTAAVIQNRAQLYINEQR